MKTTADQKRGARRRLPARKEGSLPEKIRIRREEGYHTDRIGKCRDGRQFMAFIVATVSGQTKRQQNRDKLRWYAVLHVFDSEGKHLDTKAIFLGTRAILGDKQKDAELKLEKLLKELCPTKYGDVEIRLFSVRIDGNKFGLVNASVPKEKYQRVDLLPNGLSFFPPWDGTYST